MITSACRTTKGDIKIILNLDSMSERRSEAFIICQTPAVRHSLEKKEHEKVKVYIKDHRHSWYHEFAVKRGYKISQKDNLVLITGLLKTKSWAMGFFPDRTALRTSELIVTQGQLDEEPTGLLDVITPSKFCFLQPGLSAYKCCTPNVNGMNQSQDQVMFLQYFKAKTQLFVSRVDALTGPHRLPTPDGDGPYGVIPQCHETRTSVCSRPAVSISST